MRVMKVILALTFFSICSRAADRCGAMIPAGGMYDRVHNWSAQTLQLMIDEYISHKEYKTHDEAIADGFTIGAIIYGVPIKAGNDFTKEQRDSWKLEYEKRYKASLNQADYRSFESVKLNTEAFREVTHCIIATSQVKGLNVDLLQVDACHFKFYAWYNPNSITDFPPHFKGMSVNGAKCESAASWFVTYGGWQIKCERTGRDAVQIGLNSSSGPKDAEKVEALPDPGPEPAKPENGIEYKTTNPAGQPYTIVRTFEKNRQYKQPPEVFGGGHKLLVDITADGPITGWKFLATGQAGGWTHEVVDQNIGSRIDGNTLHWVGWADSGDQASLNFYVTYKAPIQVCVTNCDYADKLRAWQDATNRTCAAK